MFYRGFVQTENRYNKSRFLSTTLIRRLTVSTDFSLRDLQELIRTMYYEKDAARGAEATFLWFTEEIGELAAALRNGSDEELQAEFADVLAWLVTLANIRNVDLTQAVAKKYGTGCPGCGKLVCQCPDSEKP
jgi:NTP pyrophosphatase (non-canonical NTP hydrolase)